jgi:hypothetical protein
MFSDISEEHAFSIFRVHAFYSVDEPVQSVNIYQTIWRLIPEDINLHSIAMRSSNLTVYELLFKKSQNLPANKSYSMYKFEFMGYINNEVKSTIRSL